MNKFYIENKEDLRILIVNTARKRNISEAVIEKDYWVTFILDYPNFEEIIKVLQELEKEINK